MGCFTREQLVELVGTSGAANMIIYDYQKKGLIEKVKRDFYAVISMETKLSVLSRYQLASKLFPDACLTHHSAFEVYGYGLPWNEEMLIVLSVAPLEIFASKTVALLTRTAPRDLYDMHNMVKFGLFDESEEKMLRKCAVFFSAIGAEYPPKNRQLNGIATNINSDGKAL